MAQTIFIEGRHWHIRMWESLRVLRKSLRNGQAFSTFKYRIRSTGTQGNRDVEYGLWRNRQMKHKVDHQAFSASHMGVTEVELKDLVRDFQCLFSGHCI